jgi:DNA-binding NarL/FixJ family response regulator
VGPDGLFTLFWEVTLDRDPKGESVIHVVVADSTRVHSQLLADAVKRDRRIHVVGSVSTTRELLELVAKSAIDIALISSNIEAEPSRGFSVLHEIRSLRPSTRAVMLLDSTRGEAIIDAFRAGAKGVYSKHEEIRNLCKCIRCVYEGQVWVSRKELNLVMDALATAPEIRVVDANGISLLSARELEVVRCLAEGITNREIGQRMRLSKNTVKNYLLRIFDKMGVSNRMELLFFALSQPEVIARPSAKSQIDEGVEPYRKAAEEGVPEARLQLAKYYSEGKRVARDPVAAYMWYLLAESAFISTKNRIASVRKKITMSMTTEQIAEAQQRAAAWSKRAVKPAISDACIDGPESATKVS